MDLLIEPLDIHNVLEVNEIKECIRLLGNNDTQRLMDFFDTIIDLANKNMKIIERTGKIDKI